MDVEHLASVFHAFILMQIEEKKKLLALNFLNIPGFKGEQVVKLIL